MKNEAAAKQILDRVENYLSTDLKTRDAIMNSINKAWNITDDSLALRYKNYRNALDNSKFGSGVVGFITAGGNVLISNVSGEDTVETVMGLGVDVALTLMELTPAGRVINIALTLTGFDPATKLKDIYRSLAYESEADYNNNKIAKLVGAKSVTIEKNILKVTMPDGTVYARPLSASFFPYGVTPSGLITGGNGWTNDVLFGGNGNDTLMGKDGSDLLIGGNGDDTYLATKGDTIKDSDGKGSVHFNGHKLTGGTYDKDRDLYISDDYIEYKLHDDGRLVVSDMGENIVIENFNKDNNDLGIILIDPKDVVVTIHDNQANEGGNGKHTLGFKVSLNRKLEAGEYLTLYINGQLVKFTENEQEKDNAYIYEWDGNESKDGDRKFEVSGSVLQSGTSKNLNVKYIHPAKGLIKDDDRDDDPDPEREASPIVIDLGNDGINSHALNYTINFDLDNNGFKEATGWVSGDDALLAIDKNNNGIIDNGSELFGNKSISDSAFSYTNSSLNNGFETLKSYDSNNDGIIDSQDAEFDKLLLWQDKNGNAITDNGELIKLSDKVSSIDLNYTNTDINNNSNTIRQTSTATLNDGTKVKADDIWFKVNYKDTEEIIDENEIPFEIKSLPNVTAFGNLHSLHYAMAKNETLATMVNLYLLMDSKTRKENINTLISEWAGVSDIDENARRGNANARKVAVYEILTGKPFLQRGSYSEPGYNASAMIEDYYNKFSNFVYATIELNTTYSYLNLDFDILKFDESLGKYSYDFSSLNSAIQSLYNDGNLDEISNLTTIIRTVLTYKPYAYNLLKENYTLNFANEKELLSLLYCTHITGTANNDTLNGTNEADYLKGLGGNDNLYGGYGDDVYEFNGNFGNDTIYDTAGNDSIYLDINSDKISLKRELANLIIQTKDEAGELSGNKITIQNYFNINPELGNGVIENIKFADGTIWSINEILANAPLNATDGSEKFYLTDGSDEFNALDGDDTIYGGNGNDTINGDDGNDILYGDNGNDTLDGGAGNDNLQGGDGNDTLIGGIGNDSLQGGDGNDTYIYNLGDGADTITDYYGSNTIKFGEGISKEDITITRINYNDLKLTFKDNQTDSIILKNGAYSSVIENVEFASGETLKLSDLVADITGTNANDILYAFGNTVNGGDGNDTIYGSDKADTIIGGKGNDSLNGGNGNDVYIFNIGDGNDTITDNAGTDTIKFGEGISKEDLIIKKSSSNAIKICFKNNSTDNITLSNLNIENFEFANGDKLTFNDIKELPLYSSDENETIYGYNDKANIINALGGNDSVYGGNANDTLNGGDGNDTISAGNGNDTIKGGTGNDNLQGGNGDDIYVFNKGDGVDTIVDWHGNDTIKFNDFNQEDIELKRELTSLVITSKISDDKIVIQNFFDTNANTSNPIEKIIFKDSSEWNLNEILANATIKATGGNDKFYLTPNDDEFDALGGDDTIYAGNGNDNVNGNDGNDTLYADNGNDTLSGGTGNDKLYGGYGNDTYIYNLGDGDDTIEDVGGSETIKFGEGISKDDLIVQKVNNSSLKISFKNSSGSLMLNYAISNNNYAIENFEFANGDKLTFNDIKALSLIGSDENDTITGYNDMGGVIIGAKGNDSLNGGNKDEVYRYNLGDGDDTITERGGNNIIEFGEGISKSDISVVRHYNGLKIFINNENNQGSITITNDVSQAEVSLVPISEIKFANGETLIFEEIRKLSLIGSDNNETIEGYWELDNIIDGKAGNDTIYGGNKNDTLIGSLGNDSLNGGNGNDTYIYNKGDGNDTISDTAGNDTIEFGEGISKDDIIISTLNNSGSLKISFKNDGGSITFSTAIENIKFANGETLNLEEIKTLSLIGKDSNDKIYGFANRDNEIQGNAGDDELNGNNANDTLIGGKGNDKLNGGNGNDTYIFNIGDGKDEIYEESGNDIIEFGDGISKDSLIIKRSEDNDLIKFQDGSTLNFNDIKKLSLINSSNSTETLRGYDDENNNIVGNDADETIYGGELDDTINAGAGNDTIYGLNSNDTIKGNDGDDTLYGEYGNDTLIGGTGNDTLQGGDGDDTYIFNLGDGKDEIYESSGNDTIEFGKGISKDSLIVIRDGENNLKIYVKDNPNIPNKDINLDEINDVITLKDVFSLDSSNSDQIIESVKFNDSSTISFNELKKMSMLGLDNNQTNIKGYDDMENIIKASQKDTTIQGGDLKDTIYGGQNNDIINANDGNDTVYGNGGDDIIYGGSGDDILYGNEGNDTISDFEGNNKIFGGDGDDIITSIGTIYGDSGNDTIKTFTNNYNDDKVNTIYGGTGNDTLNGGAGSDIYMFNSNDGADIITDDGGDNTVKFTDINKDNITVKRGDNLNDLVIITDNNDSITIKNFYTRSSYKDENGSLLNAKNGNGIINKFIFANQTELNYEEFHKLSYNGKDSDDLIYGLNSNDFINGGKGNDTIYARDGDDTLYGNDGDDILNGDLGNDTLIGGSGNDTLLGGDGDDTYIFNLGDGKDEIYEESGNDIIEFGKGISKDSLIMKITISLEMTRMKLYTVENSMTQ